MTADAGDTHIFVYGTLLTEFAAGEHPTLRGRARLIDSGSIPGLLFDAGDYPAAVPDAANARSIRGELHAVSPAEAGELLDLLDRYEGFLPQSPDASLFVRERVTVHCDGGERVGAWVYRYNRSVDRLTGIADGDYLAYLRRGGRPRTGAEGRGEEDDH